MSDLQSEPVYVRYPREADTRHSDEISKAQTVATTGLPVVTFLTEVSFRGVMVSADAVCLPAVILGSCACFFVSYRLFNRLAAARDRSSALPILLGVVLGLNPIVWTLLFRATFAIALIASGAVVCSVLIVASKLTRRSLSRLALELDAPARPPGM